ncbi:MAG: twin-arginine translocase TatA/TatE family subunit [Chloroflexi bacterium]|nr:twin-arginine translocase TatA/TatE family subunit [Chloroflexota bacterium]|tara:strand:- start:2295 stop:2477 length:183 start_codon:yes stop_codon:yes gene_type:complete
MNFLRGMGWPEILLILVVVMIIFGIGRLPEVGSGLGKGIRQFKKALSGKEEEEKSQEEKK